MYRACSKHGRGEERRGEERRGEARRGEGIILKSIGVK
jgi:hypothetical protein